MSEMTPARLRSAADACQNVSSTPHWRELARDLRQWASELEGRTQPTRDEVAQLIAGPWDPVAGITTGDCFVTSKDYDAADALVARGWLGVSDTPNEGGRE